MTANDSQTKSTNKRITKNDLNELAKSRYGEEVYCEHIRSGKRGWYLHLGTQPIFIGTNATEAYVHLQSQESITETVTSKSDTVNTISSETTSNTKCGSEKIEEPDSENIKENKTLISASSKAENAKNETLIPATSKIATPDKARDRLPISAEDLLEIFFEKFSNTFFREAEKIRPIQKYIHKKIRRASNYEYTKDEVSATLALYTQSIEYCQALIKGGQRIDLEGKPCGEVSEQHQEDAKLRLLGEKSMRPTKQKKPKPPIKSLPPPQLEQLVKGKMELCVKINDLPGDSKTTRNGWEEFIIEIGKQNVKMTVRPRTWKKLQVAAREYPSWVANIRGKMGPCVKNNFELLNPGVQIFEKIPKQRETPVNSENETPVDSNSN